MGAALDAARGDAAYAQMLFLFLGLPGAVLAALLTAAMVGTGATRRRTEQALLRTRGLEPRRIASLAAVEAVLVGVTGGVLGLAAALVAGRVAFGPVSFGSGRTRPLVWFAVAFTAGLLISLLTVLAPALRDLRTVDGRRRPAQPEPSAVAPWWTRTGVDLILLAGATVVFLASSRNNYTLVLAPEGVASISVSYWAFLGPALLWLGSALLLWRLVLLGLTHGRRPISRLIAPFTGRLARPGAAALSRQGPALARAVVLLALAVSFAVSTAVFNATYQQQAEADAQLTNGADVTVTPAPGTGLGPDARRRTRRHAGGAERRANTAPVRLRRCRPAGPVRRPTGVHHPRHRPPGRVLPGRQREGTDGDTRRATGRRAGQRRDGQGLPTQPRRPAEPAAPKRRESATAYRPVPLRWGRQRVPDGTQGQLLRRQRRLRGQDHRLCSRGRLPRRHRRPGPADRSRPHSANKSATPRRSPTSPRPGRRSAPA